MGGRVYEHSAFVHPSLANLTFDDYGGIMSPGRAVSVTDFSGDRRSDVLLYRPTDGLYFSAMSDGAKSFTWTGGTMGTGRTIVRSRPSWT